MAIELRVGPMLNGEWRAEKTLPKNKHCYFIYKFCLYLLIAAPYFILSTQWHHQIKTILNLNQPFSHGEATF